MVVCVCMGGGSIVIMSVQTKKYFLCFSMDSALHFLSIWYQEKV